MKVKATANYSATVQHPSSGMVFLTFAAGEEYSLDDDLVELVNHDRPGTLAAPAPAPVVAPKPEPVVAKTRQAKGPPHDRSHANDD